MIIGPACYAYAAYVILYIVILTVRIYTLACIYIYIVIKVEILNDYL